MNGIVERQGNGQKSRDVGVFEVAHEAEAEGREFICRTAGFVMYVEFEVPEMNM